MGFYGGFFRIFEASVSSSFVGLASSFSSRCKEEASFSGVFITSFSGIFSCSFDSYYESTGVESPRTEEDKPGTGFLPRPGVACVAPRPGVW